MQVQTELSASKGPTILWESTVILKWKGIHLLEKVRSARIEAKHELT